MSAQLNTSSPFDQLEQWIRAVPTRRVESMRRINGKWIVSLRGSSLHTSHTQDTLESALKTALMIAAYAEAA